ncbi:MAG TPA: methyltransferase domain-containing protein [Solirubrobacteraceae bacterium]|nr:methyltransferase domain-containing protein [Solirubrobacteraceae bacterium]
MLLTVTAVLPEAFAKDRRKKEWRLDRLDGLRRELSFLVALRALPPRVALFQLSARRVALRIGDRFSLVSTTRPRDLATLMGLARGRRYVVELGTGTAWTTISLALADRRRTVVGYDPVERSERELYLQLTNSSVRNRIELIVAPGVDGTSHHRMVDLLYIDSSHGRGETIREVRAWQPFLADGALLVLDDFTHPLYPGVREAVTELRLSGEQRGALFVHRVGAGRATCAPTISERSRKLWVSILRRCASTTRRVTEFAHQLMRRVRTAIEDRRLVAEQQRGVLGPAHLRWRGNSPLDNRRQWTGYDWSGRGEEWNASVEWKQALIEDVLDRWIPAGAVVLEIGPGAGRWSQALAIRGSHLVLVDVSERPLELCRERFSGDTRIQYVLSSGNDLPGVEDGSIDAVWSFDVFVHVAPRDQAAYLEEIARVLAPGGVAVVHHSDGRNRGQLPSRRGWRSPMSRELFAAIAVERGLLVECQLDSWGPGGRYDLSGYADAITVCRRRNASREMSCSATTMGPLRASDNDNRQLS